MQHKPIVKSLKARTDIAFFSLLIPVILFVSGVLLSAKYDGFTYWIGQLLVSFFFL